MALTERDKIVLGKMRKLYYLKPNEGFFRRKKDNTLVKGKRYSKTYLYTKIQFRVKDKRFGYLYHRAIWLYIYGELPKVLDHIDGDPTNNRVCNLRAVTRSENSLNSVYQWKPNKDTGLPGVGLKKDRVKKFRVSPRNKDYYFYDNYEAFFWLMFIGRFYK